MKKIFTPVIFIIILIVTVTGCKKDHNNVNCTDGSANFPFLAKGHQSVLHFSSIFYGDDTVTNTIGPETNGKYPVNISYKYGVLGISDYTGYWWACGDDFYEDTLSNSNIHWTLSLNSNIGDSWSTVEGSNVTDYTLLSKNATVTTNLSGQTFTNCYEYTVYIPGDINVDTAYFQPNVGEVYYDGLLASYEIISRNY